jgi:hypothetical protein
VTIDLIRDGRFVERWGQVDSLGMLQQLSVPKRDLVLAAQVALQAG